MQIAEKDAQIEYFTEEIVNIESKKKQLEDKLGKEKPFNVALIEKVDKVNADWIETEGQSDILNQLRDQVVELNAEVELKDQLLYEAGEKMITLKVTSPTSELPTMETSYTKYTIPATTMKKNSPSKNFKSSTTYTSAKTKSPTTLP